MLSDPFRRSCAAALAAFSCYAVGCAIRIVYAEYLTADISLPSTRTALRLTLDDPNLHLQLAYLLVPGLIPNAPAALTVGPTPEESAVNSAINTAISLDPYSSSVRLEAADVAEQQHDYLAAEAHLRNAVLMDRTFNPRWAIAQFYSRHRDNTRFWPALRTAIAASYDDIEPLLETAWNFTPTPAIVLPEALPPSAIPIRTPAGNPARSQYLDFLVAKKRLDLAAPVAASLLPTLGANPQSTPSLLAYCDQLLWHGQPTDARQTWNALAAAHLIPYPALNPDRTPNLTNSSFENQFLQQAFDWRLSSAPGIAATQCPRDGESPAVLRFEFSGKQIEHVELASQFVLLSPGRTYRLTVSYLIDSSAAFHTADRSSAPDTGFHVRLIDAATGKQDRIAGPPLADRPGAQSQTYSFTAPSFQFPDNPATNGLYRLVLTYDRSLGSTRFEGVILLHRVDLAFAS